MGPITLFTEAAGFVSLAWSYVWPFAFVAAIHAAVCFGIWLLVITEPEQNNRPANR